MSASNETVLQSGVEEIEPGVWLVSIFDMLGCYSSGISADIAIAAAPAQARQYYQWLASKDGGFPDIVSDLRVEVIERIPLHGFFKKDADPLRMWDVELADRVLQWNRQDLLDSCHPEAVSSVKREGINNSEKLFEHLYRSELWLLSRLGFTMEALELPSSGKGRMEVVRQSVLEQLGQWVDAEFVRDIEGERWSPRKVLRRLLWHDRDHLLQK
jgi:hypothetical protein